MALLRLVMPLPQVVHTFLKVLFFGTSSDNGTVRVWGPGLGLTSPAINRRYRNVTVELEYSLILLPTSCPSTIGLLGLLMAVVVTQCAVY